FLYILAECRIMRIQLGETPVHVSDPCVQRKPQVFRLGDTHALGKKCTGLGKLLYREALVADNDARCRTEVLEAHMAAAPEHGRLAFYTHPLASANHTYLPSVCQ